MRITSKLLRHRAKRSLNCVEYVDLCNLSLVFIEKLQQSPKLQTVILRGNSIELISNLESCHELWRLDLENNQITNLEGLSKFVALGELNLAKNDLTWADLMKIRHMHILDLSLHGNKKLVADSYYRIHVIDSLPNVWMLDGRIITSAERIQVEQFFQDSALSERPVRRKLTRKQFVPTSMKKIRDQGVYGKRTTHFMMRFPTSGSLNIDTDCRRLKYIAWNLQQNLQLESQHRKSDPRLHYSDCFLENLLDARSGNREHCNVLLLLLVASLEFALPTSLVQEMLSTAGITTMGNCDIIELFLMAHDHRCQVVSLLLSAVKIDRDNKEDGGLYDKLYLSLYYSVTELFKKKHLENSGPNMPKGKKVSATYREYKSLLAAEVVQLFCVVPAFFDYINTDAGTMDLVSVATSDSEMANKIASLVERIRIKEGGTTHRIIEEVAGLLINTVQSNTKHILNRKLPSRGLSTYILSTSKVLPRRLMSSPVYASFFLTAGRRSPVRATSAPYSSHRDVATTEIKMPAVGDRLLLGPQNFALIITLPEPDIGLVQMESIAVTVPNGSAVSCIKNTLHLAYVDLTRVAWDKQHGYWKPKGTRDRITIKNIEHCTPGNLTTSPTGHRPRPSHNTYLGYVETQSQKSIDVLDKNLHHSVSGLLHEHLKMNPSAVERVATPSGESSLRESPAPPESLSGNVDKLDTENMDSTTNKYLYDCLKCAVDIVTHKPGDNLQNDAEGGGVNAAVEDVPKTCDAESQNNVSYRPMSAMTEREADDILVDEFIDVNLVSNGMEQIDYDSGRWNHPGTARTSPSSRINSAKSSSSWKSLPIVKSKVIEVDLRPGSVTNYQMLRTDVWKQQAVVKSQPRSRQDSAYSRSSTPTRSRRLELLGNPVLLQYGNNWLAGGRDIHHSIQVTNRKKTEYSPGWMDGLSKRPKSRGANSAKSRRMDRRAVQSAGTSRDKVVFNIARPASQPPPSPASSDHAFLPASPHYLHQAGQQNYTL